MKVQSGLCALLFVLAGCGEKPADANGNLPRSLASIKSAGQGVAKRAPRDPSISIASAPDRGALIAYDNRLGAPQKAGAYTLHPIALSEEHALRAVVTGQMTVPTPDGDQVRLKYERHVEDADGNWTWIGRMVDGDQLQEAIITFGEKAVFGSIPQSGGKLPLRLTTRNGALVAITTDGSKVPDIHEGVNDVMIPPVAASGAGTPQASAMQSATPVLAGSLMSAAATPATTIDLAIGYTAGFAAALGGTSQAATRVSFLVQVGNQSFTNSQITGSLRVVHALQVNYADNTANDTALGQLTGNNGSGTIPVPASLAPLRTARDQYGADLVVLMRDFQTPENDGCGVAWLNGASQSVINQSDAPFGYAVVSDGFDTGTDGKTYFCSDETLVHELGHLMGSAHDRDNATSDSGTLQFGRYAYSFGSKTSSTAGNFYTIMSYGDSGQNFYRAFSNPAVLKCGPANTLACGVANQTDNARSLNQTIPVVASFRATVVPITAVSLNLYAIKKNGFSSTEIRGLNRATTFQTYLSSNASVLGKTGADESWAFEFGDFNGDRKADLYAIKKNGALNRTEVHVLNGSNGFSTYLLNVATILGSTGSNNSWDFKLADYNRDGKLDLYAIKKQGAGGRVEVRVLNGANNFQTYLLSTSTSIGPVAIDYSFNFELGDFNGDGNPDLYVIKKVSGTGKTEVQVLNAVGGFKAFLFSRASILGQTGPDNGWNFKVGDYNRDGVLDVYGIKKMGATGKTEVFVLNGATQFQSYIAVIATVLGETGSDASWKFGLVAAQ